MPEEAKLVETDEGLMPEGEGWFVVNARDVRWYGNSTAGRFTFFEVPGANWDDLGFNVSVLEPGQAMARYHGESNREVFLVLAGEPLLLIEGEERRLRPWDFVHCAPWAEHVLLGAGDTSSVIVCASPRAAGSKVKYVASDIAKKHGVAPPRDTETPEEAYAGDEPYSMRRYRDGDLRELRRQVP